MVLISYYFRSIGIFFVGQVLRGIILKATEVLFYYTFNISKICQQLLHNLTRAMRLIDAIKKLIEITSLIIRLSYR